LIQIVDEREACAQRSHSVAESATAIQDSNDFLNVEGVVSAVAAPSIRALEQGIGAQILMVVAQLVMGMIAVMRPRFLDTSGDELLKAALGKLATVARTICPGARSSWLLV
jgi:hypothetical protein